MYKIKVGVNMKVEVGKILKPQGIKGEMKVVLFISYDRFKDLKQVTINNRLYDIKSAVERLGFVYMTLEGVLDRNDALALHSMSIFAECEEITLDEGECFVQDMIGMAVYVGEECYGNILSVEQYGSADVITIQGRYGKWQFPYLADLVVRLDKENKKLYLDEARFDEVKV